MTFADRMTRICIDKNTRLVVGLDPHRHLIPQSFIDEFGSEMEAVRHYMRSVVEATHAYAAAFKPQIAFFEQYGLPGLQLLSELLQQIRELNVPVIMDGKRNDIGSTAAAYANAFFGGEHYNAPFPSDALTVNAYLGSDGIKPFTQNKQYGIFVLVKTSNPSSGEFQDLRLSGGNTLADKMAQYVAKWNKEQRGLSGYGNIGAVVGATYPDHMRRLRKLMPHSFILVPGYGAQGGAEDAVRAAFNRDGLGALINSSRGICFPPNFQHEGFDAVTAAARISRDHINMLAGVTSS